jgi:hypothetical protein
LEWHQLLRAGEYVLLTATLRSSGQSSWLHIQTSEFDSRRYQIP